jgi:hypothetical protein
VRYHYSPKEQMKKKKKYFFIDFLLHMNLFFFFNAQRYLFLCTHMFFTANMGHKNTLSLSRFEKKDICICEKTSNTSVSFVFFLFNDFVYLVIIGYDCSCSFFLIHGSFFVLI